MRYPILLMFIILGGKCFSQTTITFKNEHGEAVPFVYVFDSSKKLNAVADSAGKLVLMKGTYHLLIDHVSYEQEIRDISSDESAGTAIILQPRKKILDAVVVSVNQKNHKTYETGTFRRHSASGVLVHQDLKLAFISPHPPQENLPCRLTGIKFRLAELKQTKENDYVLEIKIYGIENRLISKEPLNVKPIYISSGDLRKKNEIEIKEFIPLGEEGVFLSFELPKINSDKSIIHFSGSFSAGTSLAFGASTKISGWDNKTIKQNKGVYLPHMDQYFIPDLSITYQRLND